MNTWTNNLYFIISSPRSGSSLLRNKLNDFESILALPSDMRVIEFFIQNKQLLSRSIETFHEKFRSSFKSRQLKRVSDDQWSRFGLQQFLNLDEFIFSLFQLYAESINYAIDRNTLFVEKSPNNVQFLSLIKDEFPSSKIIYLHRDGRDVVASLNAKPWASHNTFSNAMRWSIEQKLLLKVHDFKVVYEELVSRPETILMNLLDFMEYTNLSEVKLHRIEDLKKDPNSIGETGRAIHSSNKGKFLRTLSIIDRDIEIIESVCHAELEALGYEILGNRFDWAYRRKRFFLALEHYSIRLFQLLRRRTNNR